MILHFIAAAASLVLLGIFLILCAREIIELFN